MAQMSRSADGGMVVVIGETEARTAMPATRAWNTVGVINMLAIGDTFLFFSFGCIVDDANFEGVAITSGSLEKR